eukprot:8862598-Pyramimonas_sp.AAC.2
MLVAPVAANVLSDVIPALRVRAVSLLELRGVHHDELDAVAVEARVGDGLRNALDDAHRVVDDIDLPGVVHGVLPPALCQERSPSYTG